MQINKAPYKKKASKPADLFSALDEQPSTMMAARAMRQWLACGRTVSFQTTKYLHICKWVVGNADKLAERGITITHHEGHGSISLVSARGTFNLRPSCHG